MFLQTLRPSLLLAALLPTTGLLTSAVLTSAAITSSATAQEPTTSAQTSSKEALDLRLKLQKGSKVWVAQEIRNEQAVDMGGQQMEMGNSTTHWAKLEVVDVTEDGGARLAVEITRIAGNLEVPMMGDIEFDSADPAKGEGEDSGMGGFGMPNMGALGKAMTSLAGQKFEATIDAYGYVKSMTGVEEALNAARKKAGRMGGQMLGAQLNDSVFTRLVEATVGIRPKDAIAVGASWEQTDAEKSQRMEVANKMKLTLAKADADSFEIQIAGSVEKPKIEAAKADGDEDDDTAAMAREMISNMEVKNGKITGTTKLSRKDGFVVESRTVMSMEIHAPAPMGGGDMIIDQKATTTLRRATEADAMKKAGGDDKK